MKLAHNNRGNTDDDLIETGIVVTKKLIKTVLLLYLCLVPVLVINYCITPVTYVEAKGSDGFLSNSFASFFGNGADDDGMSWGNSKQVFTKQLGKIQTQFPSQTRETWLQLKSTISKTLDVKEPQNPAVITALFPPTMNHTFAKCFLQHVGLAVNKAAALALHKGSRSKDATAGAHAISPQTFQQKSITEIRRLLEIYLKTEGKAVLVEHVDQLEKEQDLLMFHAICDNYHAVDVRATILFPVIVPEPIFQKYSSWRHADGGKISNEVLTTAWRRVVGENVGPALVARIADAVILLNDGDECSEMQDVHDFPGDAENVYKDNRLESKSSSDEGIAHSGSPYLESQVAQILVMLEQQVSQVNKIAEDIPHIKSASQEILLQVGQNLISLRVQVESINTQLAQQQQEIRMIREHMSRWWWSFVLDEIKEGNTNAIVIISFSAMAGIAIGMVVFALFGRNQSTHNPDSDSTGNSDHDANTNNSDEVKSSTQKGTGNPPTTNDPTTPYEMTETDISEDDTNTGNPQQAKSAPNESNKLKENAKPRMGNQKNIPGANNQVERGHK